MEKIQNFIHFAVNQMSKGTVCGVIIFLFPFKIISRDDILSALTAPDIPLFFLMVFLDCLLSS